MKKYLLVVFLAMIALPANAEWQIDSGGGCAHQVWVWPWHSGRDDYYFCGAHTAVCGGDYAEDDELLTSVVWAEHKQSATIAGSTYWCCGGKVYSKPLGKRGTAMGTPGRWVQGDNWYKRSDPKEKIIGGATCSYIEKEDVCGNVTPTQEELEKLCTKQNTNAADGVSFACPDGQYWRESTNSCAALCGDGQAYESETSNKCVDCAETLHQGISCSKGNCGYVIEPEDKICRKCYSNAFFDPVTRNCVEKTELIALSTTELQYGANAITKGDVVSKQCWTKYNEDYKNCVLPEGVKKSSTDNNSSDNTITRNLSDTPTNVYQNQSNGGNIEYSWGRVSFRAYCLDSGSRPTSKPDKSTTKGQYCWCVTDYSNNSYAMPQYAYKGNSWCNANNCTQECVSEIKSKASFREKLAK